MKRATIPTETRAPDEQLAVRAAAGDQDAFRKLVQRFAATLRFYARSQYAAGQQHDDYTQAALIGLWEACRSYRADRGANFRTFAETAISRQVADLTKASTRLKHRPLAFARSLDDPVPGDEDDGRVLGETVESPALSADEWIEVRDTVRALVSAVDILTPLERESLVGFVFNGETYKEIEARLVVFDGDRPGRAAYGPVKVVDNAIERARRKLRRYLDERAAA